MNLSFILCKSVPKAYCMLVCLACSGMKVDSQVISLTCLCLIQVCSSYYACKNVNFQMKIVDMFLISARNMDCG